ncbi:MAG: glycosyltransferase, partial [Campylobacteraceae bacterium]|nr:glycosyltransferase [Campylobacteraceae bacterium]MDY4121359.1 glycosyltransferase [Campylobacter sp.]
MKTLAYHSPFLPQKSGISHYSSELLSALKAHYDITLVSDEAELLDQEFPIITYERFYELMSDESTAFDRVIYNMGNNTKFHKIIYECSIKHSGVVILHDFFISGFIGDYHNWNSNNLIKFISKHYDIKAALEYFFNNYAIFEKKYPLNLPLIEHSKAVIVHTEQAMDLALKFYKNNDFLNIVPHLRINEEIYKNENKSLLKLNNTRVYGVFGYLHPLKQNMEILYSWHRVMKDKNARLFFVGSISDGQDEYLAKIQNFIKEKNITNVEFIGWADSKIYKEYLQACDICICLRKIHLGEASGVILDSMNYENTIITNFSSFDDCAIYVPQVSDDGHELDAALLKAYNSDDSLAKRAKERIIKEHDPDMCAKKIFEITERAYREPKELKCFKN